MKDYNEICLSPLEGTVIEEKGKPEKAHDEYRTLGLKDNQNELND